MDSTILSFILDPATFDFMWTVWVSFLLCLAGALTISRLPWTDEEIAGVDAAARSLIPSPMPRRATLRQ